MSIASEIIRNDYTGNGVLAAYPFEFIIYDQDDIDVFVDGVVQVVDVNFTIAATDIEDDSGGNVVFGVGHIPADGSEVALISSAPYLQSTVLAGRDETYEETYDKAVILIKQLREMIDRTLQFVNSSPQAGLTLPEPETEYHLRWTEALDGLENIFVPEFPSPVAGYLVRWKSDLSGLENVRYNLGSEPFTLADVSAVISLGAVTVSAGPAHYIVDISGAEIITTEGGVDILTEGGDEILTESPDGMGNIIERVKGLAPGDLFTVSCQSNDRVVTIQAGAYLVLSRGLQCVLETTKYEMLFRMGQGGVAHELSRSANQTV